MTNMRKLGLTFLFGFLFTIAFLGFSDRKAMASATTLPDFYFKFEGVKRDDGSEYVMTDDDVDLIVTSDEWAVPPDVEWSSSEHGIVTFQTTGAPNRVRLIRKSPGYATITATMRKDGLEKVINCRIKVNLAIDYIKTDLRTITISNNKVLYLDPHDPSNSEKRIFLQGVSYNAQGEALAVSGSSLSIPAVIWESGDESVATVDKGLVKAVGPGSTTITVRSIVGDPMEASLRVVVKPEFDIRFGTTTQHSSESNTASAIENVPSSFIISTQTNNAAKLKWEIYDCSNNQRIPEGSSGKMSYTVSLGNILFDNVKAGTYEIYAFAADDFYKETNVPYAYMKIEVPINFKDQNVVMSVGDTYSLFTNTNIPSDNIFSTVIYDPNNTNVVRYSDGIITARGEGKVKLTFVYDPSTKLFSGSPADMTINITVIDGISLSTSKATMPANGTLLLDAILTNKDITRYPVTWSSEDPSIATVDSKGLVTATSKAGTTRIIATQVINGVAKRAVCEVTVQPTMNSITMTPDKLPLPINGIDTITATINPEGLSDVKLVWKSSNPDIVSIERVNGFTATVRGGSTGGHAVITAINQDNVVVGYCHVTVHQPVDKITLSETNVTMAFSQKSLQLRAIVSPENAVNKDIVWETSDPSVATVTENGLVEFKKAGTVAIVAVSVDNPNARAICNINIQIPVTGITLTNKSIVMYSGETTKIGYSLNPANSTNSAVTWSSSNNAIVTVDATGKVTAKGPGTATIIVRSADGGHTAYCTVTVRRVASGVKLDASDLSLKVGESYQLKATLSPADSTEVKLTWETTDNKVVSVDGNGKLQAKSSGSAIIFVKTEGGGTAFCKVTVSQPVQGVILNFSEKTVYIGQTVKFKASVTPSEATNLRVTWKSSNEKVATVNADGEVTGKAGGMTVITCTTVDGGHTATCIVTVREPVTSITLNYDSYSIGVGKTVQLRATVISETATDQTVKWVSSNPKVATVNSKGKVTGIKYGKATITAIAQDGTEVEASCEIRVVVPATSVTLNKGYLSMLVGERKSLKATIKPNNATFKTAKWKSSDTSIAIVDDNGVVTAIKSGEVTITAEAKDNSGKKAICYVTIRDRQPATSVTVMDKKLIMVPGEQKTVQVVISPATSTDSHTWSTDNASIVQVDRKTGKIVARATGTAVVTVMTDSGKTATIEVTVIGLSRTSLTLEQYTEYVLTVEGTNSSVGWDIDNPNVAVLRRSGNNSVTVSTKATGTATITAHVNGRKLVCKLKVTKIK